jgi:NADH-quinone oxidoreductase subunit H
MLVDLGIVLGKIVVVLGAVLGLATLMTWAERKQSAVMQDRIGANRADIFGFRLIGLFHPIADALKMLTKEDFIPAKADRFLHTLAPMLAIFPALVVFAVIPFGDMLYIGDRAIKLQVADLNVGILYIFGIASLGVYGAVLAGWASNNRYGLLGGIRAGSQMISYEVSMGLSILGIVMVFQTLQLDDIARAQEGFLFGFLPHWGLFFQPLGFILFTTAAVAETKRIPFDLPEGESEIIGYFVEYSGLKFGLFMMSEFVETIVAAAVIATFFFGGWQASLPFLYVAADGLHVVGGAFVAMPNWLVTLCQVGSYVAKVVFFVWLLLLIRWTLPRFRYDQLMHLGWKIMLPLALLNVVVTGVVILIGGW